MSLRDLNSRHLRLVAFHSSRHAIRGGSGLVFVLLLLTAGLGIGHALISPVEMAREQMRGPGGQPLEEEQVLRQMVDVARPAVEWALGGSGPAGMSDEDDLASERAAREWTAFLLDERPALLSAIVLLLTVFLPFLIASGAFNQLSGDIQTRGLRYILLRTERANIFFGRFLGTAAFTAIVTFILVAVIVAYLMLTLEVYSWLELATWGLRGVLALAVISLPYIALCSAISGAVASPFASLTVSTLVVGIVPAFSFIGRQTWEPLEKIIYLLPWGVQAHLLHPEPLHVLGAAAACLGYASLFLWLGYAHFARRDL